MRLVRTRAKFARSIQTQANRVPHQSGSTQQKLQGKSSHTHTNISVNVADEPNKCYLPLKATSDRIGHMQAEPITTPAIVAPASVQIR